MKIRQIVSKFCQSRFKILPNTKQTIKILPKSCYVLPKWQNFAKSGHTVIRLDQNRV